MFCQCLPRSYFKNNLLNSDFVALIIVFAVLGDLNVQDTVKLSAVLLINNDRNYPNALKHFHYKFN